MIGQFLTFIAFVASGSVAVELLYYLTIHTKHSFHKIGVTLINNNRGLIYVLHIFF